MSCCPVPVKNVGPRLRNPFDLSGLAADRAQRVTTIAKQRAHQAKHPFLSNFCPPSGCLVSCGLVPGSRGGDVSAGAKIPTRAMSDRRTDIWARTLV
jgi:hypothetical protein